jgi:putative Holliday junction resolvase
MRCLGLDLGTRTLGVAISDKTNTLASFLKVIRFNDDTKNQMYEELCQIIKEYNITHVILGLPKNMDNSLGFASQRRVDVEIILLDERLTTVEAENILLTADMSRKKRKKVIDGVAATIILETYLRMKGN